MENVNLCLNPDFLRVMYLIKTALNILRFVIPIGLIVKTVMDLYQNLINPSNKDGGSKIKNRVVAAIIVFLVPTLVNLIMNLIEMIGGYNSYNGVSECWQFANMDYINVLESDIEEQELMEYLTDREKRLEKAAQQKIALNRLVENNKKNTEIGKNANNKNMIKCGDGPKYNQDLFNMVRSAGFKTREGVVAAALYLSSHINTHIPYFWSGGHFHSYNGYYDTGDNFMGVSSRWGCDTTMISPGTNKQTPGQKYPLGLDCSGFVAWAIFNGGYYTGDSSQTLTVNTQEVPSSIGGVSVSSIAFKNAKGRVKPGDILWKKDHVGLVVKVDDSKIQIAEEKGADYGLVITEIKYNSSRFTNVILMDNFYSNYKKDAGIWNGFY